MIQGYSFQVTYSKYTVFFIMFLAWKEPFVMYGRKNGLQQVSA